LPIPNIQIPIHNEIDNLAVKNVLPSNDEKRKNRKSYKKNQDDNRHLDKVGRIDLTQCEEELDIPDQVLSNRRQRKSVNFKQLPVLRDVPIQNNSMQSSSGSNTKATSFKHTEKTATETSIKRKKFDEFSDLLTKYIKSNANTQSILEKMLEEHLRQRATIERLEENNKELKCEILENRKLIQDMFTVLMAGPLKIEQAQQGGKTKQRLKRKDTKHM